jgi:ribonucleoside-diphosphate reductase alpha chain
VNSPISSNIVELQEASFDTWDDKYNLKDARGRSVDKDILGTYKRTARALADQEKPELREKYYEEFLWALMSGFTTAGRILANAGALEYKPATSTINCTVSQTVEDSMIGILDANTQAGLTLAAGCGIGYEFSTLRPAGAFVSGAGATTSGPLSFMDIFDKMCHTVASAGGRRGAQMATFAVWHPDVRSFIQAKREDGRLRQFNMSLLITDDFMEAVKSKQKFQLWFPISEKEKEITPQEQLDWKDIPWDLPYCERMGYILSENNTKFLVKIYEEVEATELWDLVMTSTYDFAEPGFLLIDQINKYNNNYFVENIRATNPCGEQPLPPFGSCLLGSANLARLILDPLTENARFDWDTYKRLVRVSTRMLDNVVEINGLPLKQQQHEITYKRRHGMGITGLGSALSLLGITYGSPESIAFIDEVMKTMAYEGFVEGVELAKEKGPAPIFEDRTNGIDNKELWANGQYMKRIWELDPELEKEARVHGCRFTHHTSIAPTGTISYSVNNNVSNGIEPTFDHFYIRNVIKPGRKTKTAVKVFSYEMLVYKQIMGSEDVPETWSTVNNISPKAHVDIQAAAQKWVDSSISKTINVPQDTPFEDFKDIYMYAYDKGLKGCTTFRYNPENFGGVLVSESDLNKTEYVFMLEGGEEIKAKGTDLIEYDGELHTAQNLYDAIKEGYYGKF